ncbi:MAG: tRNA-dihydrouridine synthase A [Gammaproteobacteria bacterium]|jgi:tRNA-dihydrouridine synthase A
MSALEHLFCVAPMMDATDRHCRYFLRQLSRHALLYTEMITTGAILHGDRESLLGFDAAEHPLALQVGGSVPADMARTAQIAQEAGYLEVNINVGCPSDRVKNGHFGACLMADPVLVARCVSEMRARVSIPITVKTRIGIDDQDSYEDLLHFIDTVHAGGCTTFIVHARKAWLSGLSPKQNREIPPLHYDRVHRLKRDRPELRIIINGGLTTIEQCRQQLVHVDGVMLGREVYRNPYLLADVDHQLFNAVQDAPTRAQCVALMTAYVQDQLARGSRLHAITRHMLGLFQHQPGARAWRRYLSEHVHRAGASEQTLLDALTHMQLPQDSRAVA